MTLSPEALKEVAAIEGSEFNPDNEISKYLSEYEDNSFEEEAKQYLENTESDAKPDTEDEKSDVKAEKPDVDTDAEAEETPEQAGMKRLQAREEEVRNLEKDFENRVASAVKAKIPDFSGKGPADVLKHFGIDPEIAMKQLMYERASDDNPVKAKLKEELRDYQTSLELKAVRAELERRDAEQAQRKYYQDISDGARKYVTDGADEKVAPFFTEVAKAKPDYAHGRVMQVIVQDAQERYARGENGEPLTYSEAAKRVNDDLKVLAEIFRAEKKAVKPNTNATSTTPAKLDKPVIKPVATSTEEDILENGINHALGVYFKAESKARGRK